MSPDHTDPDTFEDDVDDGDFDLEAPRADAAEQHAELLQRRDEPLTGRSMEVDSADAQEQQRVVDLDEDDYR
ncbi:hypothetical protein GQS52_08800 [Streptomyces sp. SCUT-3]|nr:hypothetical protein [Streptomyces sp. SCUT-3]MCZ2525558.1 hypothetical protein [Streptomyces sp. HB2AG]PLW71194.1 hypothetical protein C0036_19120 [Streptomyces sp. DJ]QMV24963.1 hypothetical protein GQS52_08800 [Streptomyces sp. SCUT-3]